MAARAVHPRDDIEQKPLVKVISFQGVSSLTVTLYRRAANVVNSKIDL